MKFDSQNAADAARRSHAPTAARKGRTELKQALELQEICYLAAKEIHPSPSPVEKFSREDAVALASLVRAWGDCSNRIRILQGKPLPGTRKVGPEPAKPIRPKNKPPQLAMQVEAGAGGYVPIPANSGKPVTPKA
jgi:hypothetical protein